jgi:acrylyl-CoA reductase (NADPH)
MFKALIIDQGEDNAISASVEEVAEDRLPQDGEVDIAVEYSSVNYKDGLILNGLGRLVKTYPHVPGIDFAGSVLASRDDRFKPGDKVVMHGWRGGEIRWGGYATQANEKADWLVRLPEGLSPYEAMCLGTAGFTAMQAIMRLEGDGMTPDSGEILVTGAGGGVGSVATILLANKGYKVAAMTGRPEAADYLTGLGASRIVTRAEMLDDPGKVLESSVWGGCIDSVGGALLGRILKQLNYGAGLASLGNAAGAELSGNIMPFLLRGVNVFGIDSVACPMDKRAEIWAALARDLPKQSIAQLVTEIGLADLPDHGKQILDGKVRGRIVVDVNK